MRKLLLCTVMVLFCATSYSQSTQGNFLPEVVPPSPEAAALSRFTEVPVSHYTGLANVSIPIHTIAVQGLQVPISLSYHGRGVKVSEVAPRTGQGWSLTYGGDISRQARGKADDGAGQNTYLKNKQDFENFSTSKAYRDAVNTKEATDPGYDFYPDQFTFSGGGTSGKFVLDYSDGSPVIQSFGDVQIRYKRESPGLGKIVSFEITDASGNIFYYGISKDGLRFGRDIQNSSIGTSFYYNGNQVPDGPGAFEGNYSSWKLMDIETPYGELISYTYLPESFVRYEKSYDKHDPTGTVTNGVGNVGNLDAISSKISRISTTENHLSKIEYSQGTIHFDREVTGRQDYNGYALDKIRILDKDGKQIKAFDLNYRYTTSTDTRNLLPYITGNPTLFSKSFKRMFLDNIVEKGQDDTALPPYEFTYNATVLPSRFSTAQDYWGYYNGAVNNGPFLRMFEYGFYKPDRRVHIENSKAGLLEEIKYPTGGVTRFTYEHNRGIAPAYFGFVKTPAINPNSVTETQLK
ncbi:hypothetical protein, partial [Tenacibaculum amylolyticum]|uniref:hypothetical protein n=1 Tax=Tenacibaculum amylolyticum TaxID=104269 RepID=UPI0038B5CA5F